MTALRFLVAVLLILGLLTGPLAADAQPAGKVPRIGFLVPRPDSPLDEGISGRSSRPRIIEGQKS